MVIDLYGVGIALCDRDGRDVVVLVWMMLELHHVMDMVVVVWSLIWMV